MQADSQTRLSATEEKRLLNWGPAIVPMFDEAVQYADIELEQTATGRDIKLNAGIDNLKQAITAAIVTALGADPLNLGYGFAGYAAMADETNPLMQREQLRFAVLSVLQADPRIREVQRVLIGREIELFYSGEVTPVPVDAASATPDGAGDRYRTTQIEAQFTIGSGERISLAVGPVAGGTS